MQRVIYNFHAEIQRTGSRSVVTVQLLLRGWCLMLRIVENFAVPQSHSSYSNLYCCVVSFYQYSIVNCAIYVVPL